MAKTQSASSCRPTNAYGRAVTAVTALPYSVDPYSVDPYSVDPYSVDP